VLEGEAWFGIARDVSRPLTVVVGGEEVSVLGTEFDVSVSGGGTRVLLYSGAVRVRKGGDSLVLRPGQAAVTGSTGLAVRVMNDSERALSWRGRYSEEAFFDFENSGLPAMLKELADWYGVQVSNPDSIQGVPLTGKLPRSLSLNEMLRALERVEKGHARLRVNADTIHVLPGHPGG
jgi:ferric-dicitrate binding protein FerR (iron transport regulator)